MDSVDVLIPYGGDDPVRFENLRRILAHWRPVVPVVCEHPMPFSRAVALNQGAEASGAEILVLNDADSICPLDQVATAVELARDQAGMVFCYETYVRLDADGEPVWRQELAGSQGCMAIRRTAFLELGGYDPRFVGWGFEDLAFGLVCDAVFGKARRVPGNLYHLDHPRYEGTWPEQERANELLYERYRAACDDPQALLAIRSEAGAHVADRH